MTKKTEEKAEKPVETTEFKLSDGTKVVLRKGNGRDVLRARKNAPDEESVQIYLAAQLGTFNNEAKPAEELMELPMDDFLLIETKVREFIATKNFQEQGI